MVLLDALYINDSGGKILLDYLITELEKKKLKILYLLDVRIKDNHPRIKASNKVHYIEGNLLKRHLFYKKHSISIGKVFCFGNLPPTFKLNVPVYTYFHQKLFLDVPKELPFNQKLILLIKSKIVARLLKNTTFWMVQTEVVKKEFLNKFPDVDQENVLLIPFYPSFTSEISISTREKSVFTYVSNGTPHKNHVRLIEGFVKYYQKHPIGKLYLTVGSEFPDLESLIANYQSLGIPIVNVGFINRQELEQLYKKSEFLVFPSLTESFGLGLLEAIDNGCKIIGADLPYTHAVCNPSLCFNPYDVASIARVFYKAKTTRIKSSKKLIFNEIEELIHHLR